MLGEWQVAVINGKGVDISPASPYLGYDGEKFYGFTGCNRFTASAPAEVLNKGRVDFSTAAVTMRACPDAKWESPFLKATGDAREFKVKKDELQLLDAEGRPVMLLVRRALFPQLLHGEWNVVELNGQRVPQDGDDVPFLGFDVTENRLYGYTGCNRIMGLIAPDEMKQGRVDFSSLGTTRMLCAEDRYESRMLAALSEARAISLKQDTLTLSTAKGDALLKLVRSVRQ